MAEYWEDWSGYTIGDDPTVDGPAGWTRRWHADEAVTIVDISADSPPTGFTRALRFNGLETDRRFYSFDAVDSDGDRATAKIALLLRPKMGNVSVATWIGAAARGSGTTTSETALNGTLTGDANGDNALQLGQYSSSTFSGGTNEVGSDVWSADTWYWLVFEVSGTGSSVVLYAEGDPGGTTLASHSRSGLSVTSAGWVGIFQFVASTNVDVAAVNMATGATTLSYAAPAVTTPVAFTGTVPTQNLTQDSAMTSLDLSTYFSGTETPFIYAVQTGTLPAGLSLNSSTGVISGTPTGTGTVSIVVRATDDATDTADTNSFNIVVAAAVSVVKGVQVTLYADATAQASITGITAMWWDASPPTGNPVFTTASASTDGSGVLELDLDADTALALTDPGHLMLYKLDGTDEKDSLGWQGRLLIQDIS